MRRAIALLARIGAVCLLLVLIWGGVALWRGPGAPVHTPLDLPPTGGFLSSDSADPLNIVILGTSLSSVPRYDWPEHLRRALSDCLGREVTLDLRAQPGVTILWALPQLDDIRAQAPDLILLEFAANDADLRDGISRARAARALQDIRAGIGPGPDLVLMTMNPAARWRGVMRPGLDQRHEDYRTAAMAHGLGLIDLEARWRALPRSERGLADGLHPDADLARAVIVPAALEVLGGASCRAG